MKKSSVVRFPFTAVVAVMTLLVVASGEARTDLPEPVGHMAASPTAVQWSTVVDHDTIHLIVIAPDGTVYSKQFANGSIPSFRLLDLGDGKPGDGVYAYELRVIPRISDNVKRQLAAARQANDNAAIAHIQHAAGIDRMTVQSGTLTVVDGLFINSDAEEGTKPSSSQAAATGNDSTGRGEAPSSILRLQPAPNLLVTAQDESIQGSLCVGLDCTSTESFGFDTIRMKENNTRLKFNDTSTATGFPNVNWQLTANDSASGGANKFSIDDVTNSKTPFTVTASAPTNSLFVASTGKVGLGTGTPGLSLHITASDTPAIRQEQTSAGGFTAQTWDIGANEANWFVRDLTGGSRLPLRIRPGAPTSSIDISASGNVGIGTASPTERIDSVARAKFQGLYVGEWASATRIQATTSLPLFLGTAGSNSMTLQTLSTDRITIAASGNVGINTTLPTSKLQVVGLPVFPNNAAAIAGGLTAGAFYRTGADPDPVCVVH